MAEIDLPALKSPHRLEKLAKTGLLDSPAEAAFDRFTRLASMLLKAPVALISIVDADRQFFKSSVGLPEPWASRRETPLSHSFCALVISNWLPLVVNDSRLDPRVSNNLAVQHLGVIAYLGVPLITYDGVALGALCVIDGVPRTWSTEDLEILDDLAAVTITEIERRLGLKKQHILEESLRESEQRFRGAFDAAAIGLAIVATNGRLLKVNRSLCELLGYTEQELLSRDFQSITHPEDLESDLRLLHQTLAGEISSYQMEKRYHHSLGHIVWVVLSVSLVRDDHGFPLHFVSLIEDITARKKAEQELLEAASLRTAIIDCANFSIIATDEHGVIRSFNVTAESWLGYKAEEVIGKLTPEPIHLREEVEARAEELTAELGLQVEPGFEAFVKKARLGGIEEREWTYVRKDGTRFPVRLSVTALRNSAGEVTGFVGIASDLTERRREDEYRARLMAILEATTDLIGMSDIHGRVLYLNRALREASGLPVSADISHLGIKDFHPAWASQVVLEVAVPSAVSEGVWSGETAVLDRGREIPVSQVIIAHRPPNGGPVEYLSTIMRDISEHKQMAENLRSARDAAEAAGRAKSDFLANMSHEIRTPMNGIIGMTEILLDGPLKPDQRDHAETIRNSADALLTVINDILDLSKIDAGKMTLEAIELNLRTIIEEVGDLLAPGAHRKGLEIHCWIPPDFPATLIGDPVRIRQVLTNLVGNAVKFTESGEVLISAEILNLTRDRVKVRLSVRDTGIGIAPEKQEAIFETFTQADESTNRRFGGTGLGLAICRQLAKMMGGEIGLTSIPGHGSTFWIDLTLKISADALVASVKQVESIGLEGLRVLIVDSDTTNRSILGRYLEAWGCLAQGAATIGDAQAIMNSQAQMNPIDLIFLDRTLIEAEGEAATRLIKTRRRHTPALILLRSTQRRVADPTSKMDGFDATLTKPVRLAHLRQSVLSAIPERKGPASSEPQPDSSQTPGPISPLHVLVAEDQEINRQVALRILEKLGMSADAVTDGSKAIDAFSRGGYDLIFMDIQMPGRDGIEATREIGRLEAAAGALRIPIFALTAHAMEGEHRRCLDAGMDGYVAKPFKQKDLATILRQISSKKGANTQPEGTVAANSTQGIAFQLNRLLEVCDGDREFVYEVLRQFITAARPCIEELSSAVSEPTLRGLKGSAHSLRGVCLTVGAVDLAESLQRLERASDHACNEDAHAAMAETLRCWESTRNQVEQLIAGGPRLISSSGS